MIGLPGLSDFLKKNLIVLRDSKPWSRRLVLTRDNVAGFLIRILIIGFVV